ncbi:MAG TPA: protein-glutamate O-methyltransferase, partial [Steroidobacteraceae bacterium]|nr:protein-glutamate O-methyltransferase [Steroidobacteraceae bacterium]
MSNAAFELPLSAYAMEIGDAEFEFIRHVVGQNAGIALGPTKRQLVQGRLARRVRELRLTSFAAYCDHVRNSGPEELVHLINAITTNVTAFFRENHHFELLAQRMLPEAIQRNAVSRRIRIWSAGCSSGEEAYSIAMTVAENMPQGQTWDVKILAVDIDSHMIQAGVLGVYPEDRMQGIPLQQERQRRWWRRGTGAQSGMVKAKPELANMISFRLLNLLEDWPVRGPFDVIFCRNVMIYFDQTNRERLIMRFANVLADGGYLCLGHSESIHDVST